MDATTFRIWAKLMHHQSDAVNEDVMIAATALRHKLTVVTRNVRDFERFKAVSYTHLDVYKRQRVLKLGF